ncbi:MAG TPA: ABC transporter permease, partial [Gemmatimonadaceae bacterium]|nr:ABC transporter permease [Gemmatimonadaceae bacterium]
MTPLELLRRLRDRFGRDRLARELEEELRFHRALLERDRLAGDTRRRLGNITRYREETRDMWSLGSLDDLLLDLRFVFRVLRSEPAFSIVVTLTLALGIGATMAMYAVIDRVLFEPLPYPAPASLVQLADVQNQNREAPADYPEYLDWKARTRGMLSDIGVSFNTGEVLETADGAEQLQGTRVSVSLPGMLGIRPILGRAFHADEEAAGAPRVVILSEALWRSRFGGDRGIIGRTITLTGQPTVVIGVFPSTPNARQPSVYQWSHGKPPLFWLPLQLDEKSSPRGLHWLDVVGRLRPGVTLARARAGAVAVARSIQQDEHVENGLHINPLGPVLVGAYRQPLELLLAAVVLLLCIACANVASLMLTRAAMRTREFAVRTALGAGRGRLLRLVLAESLVRAGVGGALGVGLAFALVHAMRGWLGDSLPRLAEVSIDGRVVALAVAVSAACGLALGIIPALRSARGNVAGTLRDGGRGAVGSAMRDRARRVLVVGEIALSFMLLATAGLLTRSVSKLLDVPTGFDPANLVAGSAWLPSTTYPDSVSQRNFFDRLMGELGAVYGARRVTLTSDLPITTGVDGTISVEGRTDKDGPMPNADKRIVGTTYFDVMGARLAAGRVFRSTDGLAAPPVVVVNQTFARQIFPGENAVGKRVGFDWGIDGLETIVGVIADLREGPLAQPPHPAIYISAEQRPNSFMHFIVRTSESPAAVAGTFKRILRHVDPTIPLVETTTMTSVIRTDIQQQRISMLLLGGFALAALLLAAIGLYGVISYTVAQRTQELGVRAALGALPRDLMALVLRQTALLVAIGLALGAAGAVAARALVAWQLFGIGAGDPATLTMAAVVLASVAFVATII